MRPLIKHFAEQAGIYKLNLSDETEYWIMEKFAELIIEEVYDYILNATFDDEPWPSRKDVKQHFGVE